MTEIYKKVKFPFLYGELEILDTPAGRILEAMYKGGANLYVSSRAAGKLVPVPGQNYSLVKPDQYHVHTFDIVCRPGFLQAHPMFEAVSEAKETVHEAEELKEEKIEVTTSAPIEVTSESTEIAELKGQINKLAKILEKVVDDVYEEEPVEERKEENLKEALPALIDLLAHSNISEEAFSEIIDMIKGDL